MRHDFSNEGPIILVQGPVAAGSGSCSCLYEPDVSVFYLVFFHSRAAVEHSEAAQGLAEDTDMLAFPSTITPRPPLPPASSSPF